MSPTDQPVFSALLAACMEAVYDKPVTAMMLEVWFAALAVYSLDEVRAAFNRHVTDPDHGQFPPKPADIIRAIDGGGDGRALGAWSQVDRAIRHVGGWRSVCFDDPMIHACIADMGGWVKLCETTADELAFRQIEFAKRYRALMLAKPPHYPPHLIGRIEAGNALAGFPSEPPLLLGDAQKAAKVCLGGRLPKSLLTESPMTPSPALSHSAEIPEEAFDAC